MVQVDVDLPFVFCGSVVVSSGRRDRLRLPFFARCRLGASFSALVRGRGLGSVRLSPEGGRGGRGVWVGGCVEPSKGRGNSSGLPQRADAVTAVKTVSSLSVVRAAGRVPAGERGSRSRGPARLGAGVRGAGSLSGRPPVAPRSSRTPGARPGRAVSRGRVQGKARVWAVHPRSSCRPGRRPCCTPGSRGLRLAGGGTGPGAGAGDLATHTPAGRSPAEPVSPTPPTPKGPPAPGLKPAASLVVALEGDEEPARVAEGFLGGILWCFRGLL